MGRTVHYSCLRVGWASCSYVVRHVRMLLVEELPTGKLLQAAAIMLAHTTLNTICRKLSGTQPVQEPHAWGIRDFRYSFSSRELMQQHIYGSRRKDVQGWQATFPTGGLLAGDPTRTHPSDAPMLSIPPENYHTAAFVSLQTHACCNCGCNCTTNANV